MTAPARVGEKVCFIAGPGHSGGTLLGYLLGSHSSGFYCGETDKIALRTHDDPFLRRLGHCKFCGPECRIWSQVDAGSALDIYEQVSQRSGRPLTIDSSHYTLDWLVRSADTVAHTSAQSFLVLLMRDGRAVVSSRVRKYPDKSLATHIREWADQVTGLVAFYQAFRGPKTTLHYEDLATDPGRALRDLCDFLAIGYEAPMLDWFAHEHHLLGGNNGTHSLVARARGARRAGAPELLTDDNRAHYEAHDGRIRLDLRWRDEMPESARTLFDQLAGEVNAELRWGDD